MLAGKLVNMMKPPVFAEVPTHYPSPDWEMRVLSYLIITFQRDGSQVLEKNGAEL